MNITRRYYVGEQDDPNIDAMYADKVTRIYDAVNKCNGICSTSNRKNIKGKTYIEVSIYVDFSQAEELKDCLDSI